MEQKKFTLEMIEEAAEKVLKDNPYPKYLGDGLYQVADNCIVGEKMMKAIHERIKAELTRETQSQIKAREEEK